MKAIFFEAIQVYLRRHTAIKFYFTAGRGSHNYYRSPVIPPASTAKFN